MYITRIPTTVLIEQFCGVVLKQEEESEYYNWNDDGDRLQHVPIRMISNKCKEVN